MHIHVRQNEDEQHYRIKFNFPLISCHLSPASYLAAGNMKIRGDQLQRATLWTPTGGLCYVLALTPPLTSSEIHSALVHTWLFCSTVQRFSLLFCLTCILYCKVSSWNTGEDQMQMIIIKLKQCGNKLLSTDR